MYQNYHRHSHYSNVILTDSVATNEDYAKRAVELGQTILSSCEHGTPGAYREVAELAEKYGLKWRYVMEAYFVKDKDVELKDKTNCHIILAAKTEKGIGDLNEAMSEAFINGYYYRPRIDLSILLSLDPKDVFITTACLAGVWRYGDEEAERLIQIIHNHFGDSFMIEVQYHNEDTQKKVNQLALSLYRKYGIPLIAGMDSHYIFPEDKALRTQRLQANDLKYEDVDGFYMDYPDEETAIQRFRDQGVLPESVIREAMDNTNIFLTFDDVTFDKSRKLPTIYPNLSQEERNEKYRQLIRKKWLEYRNNVPRERWEEYEKGIAYEVDTITGTNTSDYFLLDYELVKRGKELGGQLTKTGRGSAGSYVTNTLLGLSTIDRFSIPVTMYPDRFISKDRLASGSLPDIDMNISDQAPFAQAQTELLGEWRSAPMIAFGTMKRLAAWKMYCRAESVDFDTANSISDALKNYELDVKHADDDEKDNIDVMTYVPPEYSEIVRKSERYMGIIATVSPHPCAYVLCTNDVRREFGVIRLNSKTGKKKIVYAAFIDGQTADRYGYLKNDWLVVTAVTMIGETYKRIGISQPTVPELMRLIEGDAPTWEMYSKGYVMGLNQVERDKSRDKVMRFHPHNLSEMAAFVAGIRPAFQSMVDQLLDRRHFDYGIPALDKILQTKEMPSSFILYQEQMMAVLQYAGFTAPESYAAIKAIAKKHPEKVLPMKERFLKNFSEKLVEEEKTEKSAAESISDKVWTIVSDACSYGFNSSHATAVALDSLYMAYAKAHYPYETYATLLTIYSDRGDKDKIAKVRTEMLKGFGIRMKPPRFREDNRTFVIDKDNHAISDVLSSAKGIGKRTGAALYALRNIEFETFTDLLYKLEYVHDVDATAINILIRIGYFEEFGSTGKLLEVWKNFKEGPNKFAKTLVPASQEKRLTSLRKIEKEIGEYDLPLADRIAFEVEIFEIPITIDPTARGLFACIEVDTKFSPKIKLYNISTGTIGVMKVLKKKFAVTPIKEGDVIWIKGWVPKPAYQYLNGNRVVKPGATDLWLENYEKLKTQDLS